MTKRARRKIDAALGARIALETLREPATVTDLAWRYEVRPNQICAWMKRPPEHAARAFYPGSGGDGERTTRPEVGELYAKIGQLTAERDFLAPRSGR